MSTVTVEYGLPLFLAHSVALLSTYVAVVISYGTCVYYEDLNNSVLCMRGHISAGFFRCDVLFLQGKHSGFCHIVASA